MTRRLKINDFLGNWLNDYVHRDQFAHDMCEDLENKEICEREEARRTVQLFQQHIREYALHLKKLNTKRLENKPKFKRTVRGTLCDR
jgi:hypothetical protein